MTRTVERKPITQAMQLALLKTHAIIMCDNCKKMMLAHETQWDHHLALVDGGDHSTGNIRPLCNDCHRVKSAREHKNNAKAKRLAAAREAHHRGEKKASRMVSRPFDKTRTKKFNGSIVPRKHRYSPEAPQ